MEAIRKIISREEFKNISIPKTFGDRIEVVIMPFPTENSANSKAENETFLAANYSLLVQDDEEEDKIWEKYL